jgi:ParB family chromosome partitioning protein
MPGQPRRHFGADDLLRLAASLEADGQAVPALVRPHPKRPGHFELVGGERRWRAIREHCTKLRTLRAVIVDAADRSRAFRLSVVENMHREDLAPLEKARAVRELVDGGMQQSEVARMIGVNASEITNLLSLLDLDPRVQALLDPSLPKRQRLVTSAAVAIARLPRGRQLGVARRAVANGLRLLDVREQVAKESKKAGVSQPIARARAHESLDTEIARFLSLLRTRFAGTDDVRACVRHIDEKRIGQLATDARLLAGKLNVLAQRLEEARERNRWRTRVERERETARRSVA